MNDEVFETKTMELEAFDRAVFSGHGELTIAQGDRESLTIEAHPDILPKIKVEVVDGTLRVGQGRTLEDKIGFSLETSLTRKRIRYTLTVRKLSGLELKGPFVVSANGIKADDLSLDVNGPVKGSFDGLTARALHVDVLAPCALSISGEAEEQQVSLSGPGNYQAPRLKSKTASLDISGPGNATVWATDELKVSIHGVGNVGYYGSPRLCKRVSGIGAVARLGESPQ